MSSFSAICRECFRIQRGLPCLQKGWQCCRSGHLWRLQLASTRSYSSTIHTQCWRASAQNALLKENAQRESTPTRSKSSIAAGLSIHATRTTATNGSRQRLRGTLPRSRRKREQLSSQISSSKDSETFETEVLSENDDPDEQELFEVSDDVLIGPRIDTGNTSWGAQALKVAQTVLEFPEMQDLRLYAFRAIPRATELDIRLDKLSDQYGSPSMEDIEWFARGFYRQLEAEMGEEEAGKLSVEVSSPGAEREVSLPQEASRFKNIPMTVSYTRESEDGTTKSTERVLQLDLDSCTEEVSVWRLANVRLNRTGGKGSKLTKKQQAQIFEILYRNIVKANLFIEI